MSDMGKYCPSLLPRQLPCISSGATVKCPILNGIIVINNSENEWTEKRVE